MEVIVYYYEWKLLFSFFSRNFWRKSLFYILEFVVFLIIKYHRYWWVRFPRFEISIWLFFISPTPVSLTACVTGMVTRITKDRCAILLSLLLTGHLSKQCKVRFSIYIYLYSILKKLALGFAKLNINVPLLNLDQILYNTNWYIFISLKKLA